MSCGKHRTEEGHEEHYCLKCAKGALLSCVKTCMVGGKCEFEPVEMLK